MDDPASTSPPQSAVVHYGWPSLTSSTLLAVMDYGWPSLHYTRVHLQLYSLASQWVTAQSSEYSFFFKQSATYCHQTHQVCKKKKEKRKKNEKNEKKEKHTKDNHKLSIALVSTDIRVLLDPRQEIFYIFTFCDWCRNQDKPVTTMIQWNLPWWKRHKQPHSHCQSCVVGQFDIRKFFVLCQSKKKKKLKVLELHHVQDVFWFFYQTSKDWVSAIT